MVSPSTFQIVYQSVGQNVWGLSWSVCQFACRWIWDDAGRGRSVSRLRRGARPLPNGIAKGWRSAGAAAPLPRLPKSNRLLPPPSAAARRNRIVRRQAHKVAGATLRGLGGAGCWAATLRENALCNCVCRRPCSRDAFSGGGAGAAYWSTTEPSRCRRVFICP